MDKFELCEEIGNWYGKFFTEDVYLCIDNGDKVFKYATAEELLADWVDTLIAECKAARKDFWGDAIEFINSEILNK